MVSVAQGVQERAKAPLDRHRFAAAQPVEADMVTDFSAGRMKASSLRNHYDMRIPQ